MKKNILLGIAIGFATIANAQQAWQMKCDISSLHPYVTGGMPYFDFNPSNHNVGLIIRGDSIRTTTDGGQSWNAARKLPQSGSFSTGAIGYANNGTTIYAATWKEIHKSVDGGNTFSLVTDTLKYEPRCYAQNDSFIAFGFTACAIVYSKDAGATWMEKRIKNVSSAIQRIHVINNKVILVATASSAFYSKDGGDNWTEFSPPASTGTVNSFFFTGTDANNWFIAYSDGDQYFYKTTDGGATWNDIITTWGGKNVPVRNLYVTTNGTLFSSLQYEPNRNARYRYSTDAGQSWTLDSLDASTIAEIRGFRQTGNVLYALSQLTSTPIIRKIYVLDLGGGATSVSNVGLSHPSLKLYPNPASSIVHITCDEEMSSIMVTDLTGRAITDQIKTSTQKLAYSTASLAPGTYLIHIKTITGKTAVKKLVKQ